MPIHEKYPVTKGVSNRRCKIAPNAKRQDEKKLARDDEVEDA
jgi:hypothetical protein